MAGRRSAPVRTMGAGADHAARSATSDIIAMNVSAWRRAELRADESFIPDPLALELVSSEPSARFYALARLVRSDCLSYRPAGGAVHRANDSMVAASSSKRGKPFGLPRCG